MRGDDATRMPEKLANKKIFAVIELAALYMLARRSEAELILQSIRWQIAQNKSRMWNDVACYNFFMLIDAAPFSRIWKSLHPNARSTNGILAIINLLERRFGAKFVYDISRFPLKKEVLLSLFEIAEQFREAGIIRSFGSAESMSDEPQYKQWHVVCATTNRHIAGGMSAKDDHQALIAALAEGLERYIWFEMIDYFKTPRVANVREILSNGSAILPEHFAGFSSEQRARKSRLTLREDAEYLWIQGQSLTACAPIWLPAQVVSGAHGGKNFHAQKGEPIIITPITTGLATGPTVEFARLGGILEIIERDAFMITWLNQLTPTRIDLQALRSSTTDLDTLLRMCERYRLQVEVIRLPTDAPAYSVCAIVRDASPVGPSVTLGLRADRRLAHAAESAILEALRMRYSIRYRLAAGTFGGNKQKETVNHADRADYWTVGNRHTMLDFLTIGNTSAEMREPWENDSEKEHLDRILNWCRKVGYEAATVDLGRSKRNVSPWHIEMLVIPELLPIHQNERLPYTESPRIRTVPAMFGYEPRPTPYLDEPHPFA